VETRCVASFCPRKKCKERGRVSDHLACHHLPESRATAKETIERCGVLARVRPALVGNTSYPSRLSVDLADFLKMAKRCYIRRFGPGGFRRDQWLGDRPTMFMDMLSLPAFRKGQTPPRNNFIWSVTSITSIAVHILTKIRARIMRTAILVVTAGLFSMDVDTPDLAGLQSALPLVRATLVFDVPTIGLPGRGCRGHIGIQNMLACLFVMGQLLQDLASNGGFVACKRPRLKEFFASTSAPRDQFSNALSPVYQAATILKAFPSSFP